MILKEKLVDCKSPSSSRVKSATFTQIWDPLQLISYVLNLPCSLAVH